MRVGIIGFDRVASYLSGRRSLAGSMEKHLDSMVMVARSASRNVRIYPLTVLFTFTMVIIINCILGLTLGMNNMYVHVVPMPMAHLSLMSNCIVDSIQMLSPYLNLPVKTLAAPPKVHPRDFL